MSYKSKAGDRYELPLSPRQRRLLLAAVEFLVEDLNTTGDKMPVPYPDGKLRVGVGAYESLLDHIRDKALILTDDDLPLEWAGE